MLLESSAQRDLVQSLWSARERGERLVAPELTLEEGAEVLHGLIERMIACGEEVIGWKIARIATSEVADPFLFAAPVFSSGLDWPSKWKLVAPRAELELVAKIEDGSRRSSSLSWQLGLEIVDNHDADWSMSPAWTLSDWGLHAGAALGTPCREPSVGEPLSAQIRLDDDVITLAGARVTESAEVFSLLDLWCERLLRPWRVGDLVWTGSVVKAVSFGQGTSIVGIVEGLGEATVTT